MGFDTQRFPNCSIDEELICAICGGVLQDPIQVPVCEHTFCQGCIQEWLLRSQTCPIDRTSIEIDQMKSVPRILKTLLNRLEITCENEGCSALIKLDHLSTHLIDCEFSPKKYYQCENGCGQSISKDERLTHNCVQVLRHELNTMKNELEKYKNDVDFYKNQVSTLREFLRTIRSNNFDRIENDEILRWSNDLQIARVTHWGSMISTPDVTLQETIRNALTECACPNESIDLLMKNVHEKHWPQGLATLETRQQNRQYYESFICRSIPNKQAVVVLSCDNPHMNEMMISEPGFVIVFSHGVKQENEKSI